MGQEPAAQLWLAGGEAEPLTAQIGLYSTRLHPVFGPVRMQRLPGIFSVWAPSYGWERLQGPGGNLGVGSLGSGGLVLTVEGL